MLACRPGASPSSAECQLAYTNVHQVGPYYTCLNEQVPGSAAVAAAAAAKSAAEGSPVESAVRLAGCSRVMTCVHMTYPQHYTAPLLTTCYTGELASCGGVPSSACKHLPNMAGELASCGGALVHIVRPAQGRIARPLRVLWPRGACHRRRQPLHAGRAHCRAQPHGAGVSWDHLERSRFT